MQALRINKHGPASELKCSEVPTPTPGPSDVLVEIEAAAINPSDVVSAEGRFPDSPLPRVLGRDFAGRVAAGPPDMIGKEVWGSGGDLGITRDGTHAEYVVIPRAAVAFRPAMLSAEEAAAVGVPFQTAWAALVDRGGLQKEEWVIISGAAGAVGGAAVQIANALGARVIALVKDASEDEGVDHSKVLAIAHSDVNDLAEVVRGATDGKGADLAINAVGGVLFEPMLNALATNGRMVIFSAVGGREVSLDLFAFYRVNKTLYGLNTAFIDATAGARILDKIAPLFDSGAIAPPRIGARFPLSRATEAYQYVSKGKPILIPDRLYTESFVRS